MYDINIYCYYLKQRFRNDLNIDDTLLTVKYRFACIFVFPRLNSSTNAEMTFAEKIPVQWRFPVFHAFSVSRYKRG